MKKFISLMILAGLMSGCSITPKPLTPEERIELFEQAKSATDGQEAVTAPITMHHAMARALLYNFESRVKMVEEEMAHNRVGASIWKLLPQVIVDGSVATRDNTMASVSKSLTTGEESTDYTTSNDRTQRNGDLRFTWNMLDLGVSYFTARQMADQEMIAKERRKRILHRLMQDVRDAYWRAVSAQRLLSRVEEIMTRVHKTMATADLIESARLDVPKKILTYKRDLYNKLLQLQDIRHNLLGAKLELAKLMNLPLGLNYQVAIPDKPMDIPPELVIAREQLEDRALQKRPELMEEAYNQRISADEIRKAQARMLPGLELNMSGNVTSNHFLMHNYWNSAGVKLSWNLLNFIGGWDDLELAEMKAELGALRYQTLAMAILAQVNVAYLDYEEARKRFTTVSQLSAVNNKILNHQQARAESENFGDMESLQLEMNAILSHLKMDDQYGQVQNALGRLIFSSGESMLDELPEPATVENMVRLLNWNNHQLMNKSGLFEAKRKSNTQGVRPVSSNVFLRAFKYWM
ncbi:MAG: TolC family protein [Magnetococcales bacterium]|nr:TolC family protein [Magnetococcales bacterium]